MPHALLIGTAVEQAVRSPTPALCIKSKSALGVVPCCAVVVLWLCTWCDVLQGAGRKPVQAADAAGG